MRIPASGNISPEQTLAAQNTMQKSDGNIHGNAKNQRVEVKQPAVAKKNESVETPLVHTPPALYHASHQSQIKPDDHYKTLKV